MSDELKRQGNEAAKAGNYDKAIELYTDAIKIDENNHILYSNRANIYNLKNDFDLALQDAEKCISIAPHFGKGYVRKADALMGLGRHNEAMLALDEGTKKDPNEPLIEARRQGIISRSQQQMMEQLFGRSEEELRQKMMANPQIQDMMQSDPSLFDKVNQARLSGNLMTAI